MRSPISLSSPLMRYATMAVDALLVLICATAAYDWHEHSALITRVPPLYALLVLLATLVLMLFDSGVYRSWRVNTMWAIINSVAMAWSVAVGVAALYLFLTRSSADVSRTWFAVWAGSTLLALCLLRVLAYLMLRELRRMGYNFKTVLLVGSGAAVTQVQHALADAAWSGLQVQAVVSLADLSAWLARHPHAQPGEVWLCLSVSEQIDIESVMGILCHSTANIRLVPDFRALKLVNHGISDVLGIPMLDLCTSPITGTMRLVKALEDRIGALIILTVICVPMLLIALSIKLTSPGPVLFKQRRHGWNGKTIWIYKFRSMVVHQETGFQVTQASRNDGRVTPLGAFLRRTSLDELPQFINVLQGRMSIVGPRPHAVQHNEYYKELVPGYMLRHKVKPGITGWAQINGLRGETDKLEKMHKRVEYDLYYIEHVSLLFDLKIILTTMFKGWISPNAY